MKTLTTSHKTVYVTDTAGLEESLGSISPGSVLYLDIETTGLDPYNEDILLLQVYDSRSDTVTVFNCRLLDSVEFRNSIKNMLENSAEIVAHNAMFELKFLTVKVGLALEHVKVYDTQIAEAVLSAGLAKNLLSYTRLDNTAKRRLGIDMDKTTRIQFVGYKGTEFSAKAIKYAADDAVVMREIRGQQIKELADNNLTATARLEFELVNHLARMELNGIKIDTVKWRSILKTQERLKSEAQRDLFEKVKPFIKQHGLFDEIPFNPGSPTQVMDILNGEMGLGLADTSELTLTLAQNEVCNALLEYREHEKLVSSFGEKTLGMINPMTGRLHPSFNQCFTATGRFSSEEPNVQQIPSRGDGAELRECFIADEGKVIVCADYSQIELRILAEMSKEPKLLEAYRDGIDIHTQTASIAFGVSVENVTSDQRKIAKILNFATIYGGGPKAISKGLLKIISKEEAVQILRDTFHKRPGKNGAHYSLAKEFLDSYFKGMPMAEKFLDKCGATAVKLRYSETPLGRKRFYTHELSESVTSTSTDEELQRIVGSIKRRGMNHPIQGCSADITKRALIEIAKRFDSMPGNGRILIQVHDEIVSECDAEYAEELMAVQVEEMVKAGEEFIKSIPVTVEAKYSGYWEK